MWDIILAFAAIIGASAGLGLVLMLILENIRKIKRINVTDEFSYHRLLQTLKKMGVEPIVEDAVSHFVTAKISSKQIDYLKCMGFLCIGTPL